VELSGEEIATTDAGNKRAAMIGGGSDYRIVGRDHTIRVDEIDKDTIVKPPVYRDIRPNIQRVPTHVRDFQAMVLRVIRKIETPDSTFYNAESLVETVLITILEKQLQTQTYAQKIFTTVYSVYYRVNQLFASQSVYSILKSTNAGKHYLIGRSYLVGLGYYPGMVANFFKGFEDTMEVAHAVVNYSNHKKDLTDYL